MDITSLAIQGAYLIKPLRHSDARGYFTKTFDAGLFASYGMRTTIREEFTSYSRTNVIRGMHMQLPPYECGRYVCALSGTMRDVILDLRSDSPTYGEVVTTTLTGTTGTILYVPPGCVHGFHALTATQTHYLQTAGHAPQGHDSGIRWDSFDYAWEVQTPTLSERDRALPTLSTFLEIHTICMEHPK